MLCFRSTGARTRKETYGEALMYHLYRNGMLLLHTEYYLKAVDVGEEVQRDDCDRVEIRDDKGDLVARLAYSYEDCDDSSWRWKQGLRAV